MNDFERVLNDTHRRMSFFSTRPFFIRQQRDSMGHEALRKRFFGSVPRCGKVRGVVTLQAM
jgi:hypothetical protein